MKLYSKYIINSLLMPTLVITFTLTGIIWLTQSLRFVDLIVNRGLNIFTFLYLSILLVPSLLTIIIPIALFCSVLHTYNKLMSDSELIVLKSAGLNMMQIARPALTVALFMVFIGYIISFFLLPASYREFKDTQEFVRNNYASALLQEGIFNNPARGITVYVESRDDKGLLKGIIVNDGRNPDEPVTMMAKEGMLVQTAKGLRFDLINGNRQKIDTGTGNLSVLYFDSYPMDLSLYASDAGNRWREPEERYLSELLWANDTMENKNKFIAEANHRILWPLQSVALTFIALSVLLSGQFNRRGQWRRIFAASVIAVVDIAVYFGLKGVLGELSFITPLLYFNVVFICMVSYYILMKNKTINIPEFYIFNKLKHA